MIMDLITLSVRWMGRFPKKIGGTFVLCSVVPFLSMGLSLATPVSASASMVPLGDSALAEVSGTGLALGFEDLRIEMSPTGYIEATGATVAGGLPYRRADARWYGLSFTAASSAGGTGYHFDGRPCATNDISCPISAGGFLVPNDNPLIVRVWDYQGVSSSGRQYLLRDGTGGTDVPTVLELLMPDWHQPLKAAFWGEIAVGLVDGIAPEGGRTYPGSGGTPASSHFLQSQTILDEVSLAGTNVRLMQFDQQTNPGGNADTTFGLSANLRITGDMRFSVNQTEDSLNALGIVPGFTDREGLYFSGVDTHLPLGSLHYQALIADQVPGGGDFILELTQIPNIQAIYEDFYAFAPGDTQGYQRTNRPQRYEETHGHWRIGDMNPATNTCTGPGTCSGTSGIVFRSADTSSMFTVYADRPSEDVDAWEDNCTGADSCNPPPRVMNPRNADTYHQVNIGDVNVSGLLIQHLRITTCSTINGAC
ncbi:MAG: hypothetical protein LAT61_04695 [Alcanivorax sp.]|nr:hypothetical protein [Alcanivorax sp.]